MNTELRITLLKAALTLEQSLLSKSRFAAHYERLTNSTSPSIKRLTMITLEATASQESNWGQK